MRGKNPSEFYYYLDNTEALELLLLNGVEREHLEFDEVRRNREKRYCDVNDPKRAEEMQGKLLFRYLLVPFFLGVGDMKKGSQRLPFSTKMRVFLGTLI